MPKKKGKIPSPLKVLVLGDSGVGRSTLISQIARTSIRSDFRWTVGLHPAAVELLIRGQKVLVALWNVASQQRYSYLRLKLFQGAKGAVYVFSIDNQSSYESIPRWIGETHSILGPIPGVIVGNKCDLEEQRCISKEKAQVFAQGHNYAYFETSILTGPNLTNALSNLISEIQ